MAAIKINKKFPFQIWGASVILYWVWTILLSLIAADLSTISGDFFFGAFLMLIASAYISIPTFLLYLLAYFLVTSKLKSIASIKLIQSTIAIGGMTLTYYLLPDTSLLHPGKDVLFYLAGYILSIVLPSLYFKLSNKTKLTCGIINF
jgi:hypothetical protein